MKQSAFVAALKFASHAMATKDVRYYLNGVLFEFRGSVLTLVGTDGHRMAYVALENTDSQISDADMIVPGDNVKLLLTAFKQNSTGIVDFEFDGDKLLVRGADGQSIRCSPIVGKYPDWRRVCKAKDKPEAVEAISLNGDYLATASKACAALGSGKNAGATLNFFGGVNGMLVKPFSISSEGILAAAVVIMPMGT